MRDVDLDPLTSVVDVAQEVGDRALDAVVLLAVILVVGAATMWSRRTHRLDDDE